MRAEPLLILCGGRSSRMGSPKPLLPWQNRTLIDTHIAAAQRPVWLAADGARFTDSPHAEYLPDSLPDKQGALSAIAPALQRARSQGFNGVYVFACDTLLHPERVAALLNTAAHTPAWREGVVMLAHGGRGLPLLAHWSAQLAPALANDVAAGQRRVHGWLAQQTTTQVPLPAAEQPLANFNTPEEFAAARAAWQTLHPSTFLIPNHAPTHPPERTRTQPNG